MRREAWMMGDLTEMVQKKRYEKKGKSRKIFFFMTTKASKKRKSRKWGSVSWISHPSISTVNTIRLFYKVKRNFLFPQDSPKADGIFFPYRKKRENGKTDFFFASPLFFHTRIIFFFFFLSFFFFGSIKYMEIIDFSFFVNFFILCSVCNFFLCWKMTRNVIRRKARKWFLLALPSEMDFNLSLYIFLSYFPPFFQNSDVIFFSSSFILYNHHPVQCSLVMKKK